MEEGHRRLLITNRIMLIDELRSPHVLQEMTDVLLQTGLIQRNDHETIMSSGLLCGNSYKSATALLDLIPRKGPEAFRVFVAALRYLGLERVADVLCQTLPDGFPTHDVVLSRSLVEVKKKEPLLSAKKGIIASKFSKLKFAFSLSCVQDQKKNRLVCSICLDKDKVPNGVTIPCMHVYSCYECLLRVDKCPVCRATISEKRRLYFAC